MAKKGAKNKLPDGIARLQKADKKKGKKKKK
jgi:hypothetical protein